MVSHLGAVVNFAAGTVKRAPRWMQKSGLEWLWRIKEEPHLLNRYKSDGLALCRLMALRVLPLAFSNQWFRATTSGVDQLCRVDTTLRADGTQHLHLQGCAAHAGLAAVRPAWQACFLGTGNVHINLGAVPWFDATFVALCLLLETALRDQGRSLKLEGLNARHRGLFKLHSCSHLALP